MASEFDLIGRYFARPTTTARIGIGDDCALLDVRPGCSLAVSTDLLVEGTHFLAGADARALGHKTLAVNLSDLAAMGARPRWATLALALPAADEDWLAAFSAGFFALAGQQGLELVGGDTTRGPRALCVTVMGEVDAQRALRRDAGRPDDDVWVSGALGGAALGLAHLQGRTSLTPADAADCLTRLHQPQPRVELGLSLLGCAHAAIDISDGFAADLGHVLARSGVGADIEVERLPAEPALARCADAGLVRHCLLAGGDDYELVFTAPQAARASVRAIGEALGLRLSRVGRLRERPGLRLCAADGTELQPDRTGFDHFA